jgi:uncharacterized protein YggU (UPF0235/DUF167 family)
MSGLTGGVVNKRKFHLHNGKQGAALTVRIIPRSSRDGIAEILSDGTVKIRLTHAADDAGLNQHLLEFLARVLQVPADRMDIVAGQSGLDKLISVLNLDAAMVHDRIVAKMD